MNHPDLFWFGCVLGLTSIVMVLSLIGSHRHHASQSHASDNAQQDAKQLDALKHHYLHLQTQLQQQQAQLTGDFRLATFERLQSLLTSYPSVQKMVHVQSDLPAKNVIALLTPLEQLMQEWNFEPIGTVWQQVPYDPVLHQSDIADIQPGELVYIRFIGYQDGDRILCPAKVSRELPAAAQPTTSPRSLA